MNERDALLRAIAANPDEDTPRLAFADLLDELGGSANVARARFIRVQIDLARNPGKSWFANAERLSEISRLAGQFADSWLGELPKWAANAARKQKLRAEDFQRGFLNTFTTPPKTFAVSGHELLDVAPVTRFVVCGPFAPGDLAAVLGRQHMPRVRALVFTELRGAGDQAAGIARTSPALGGLEELDLSSSGMTDAGAVSLARAAGLRKLRTLTVRWNRITEVGAATLLTAPALPNLRELNVRGAVESYRWAPRLQAQFPKKTLLV